MGRELKRVPIDFNWPINRVWEGYINPHHVAENCTACDGTGYSAEAKRLADMWYGKVTFRPEDRGSTPFMPDDEVILARAAYNCTGTPADRMGPNQMAIRQEAQRLCRLFNSRWCHHLNAYDVAALIEAGRLYDLTHAWTRGEGWKPKEPAYIPTPREVNIWSLSGMSHDSINLWVCVTAECKRLGVPDTCDQCNGEGEIWPSTEAKETYENWERQEPPVGEGYQIWETVSEGSPISPVFPTAEDLARHMATTRWGADEGTQYETWLAFINGPGWAPSMVGTSSGLVSGVEAVVSAA